MPPAFPAHHAAVTASSDPLETRIRASLLPRRALTWAGYGLFAMVVAFICAGTVVPALLGLHTTTVYGGSMGSSLPAGSVAVTETVGFEEVDAGDVVAFERKGTNQTVMHRAVAVEERDGQRVATLRGDSNAAADPDPLVLTGRGDRLVYYVPLLGYVLHYSRTIAVLVPALVAIFILFAWDRFGARRAVHARVA